MDDADGAAIDVLSTALREVEAERDAALACLQRFKDGWKVVNERWSRPVGDGAWEHEFMTEDEQACMARSAD